MLSGNAQAHIENGVDVSVAGHFVLQIEARMGWELVEHVVLERVHARLYRSNMLQYEPDLELLPAEEEAAAGC